MNALTERLLREGYTPDHMPEYAQWETGWNHAEYTREYMRTLTFETPCGLQVPGGALLSGSLSYGGIDFCAENDNPTIACPYILNHGCTLCCDTLRRMNDNVIWRPQCNMHASAEPYDEARSLRRVAEAEDALDKQREQRAMAALAREVRENGFGFCPNHAVWKRETQECIYLYDYDPMMCSFCPNADGKCMRCGMDDGGKKGNVMYDMRERVSIPAKGMIPASHREVVTKGIRLFDRPMRLAVCTMTAENFKYVEHKAFGKRSSGIAMNLYFAKYHHTGYTVRVENIRVTQSGRKETRDLMQDLEDIRNGISVLHESDRLAAADAQKRERMDERLAKKVQAAEQKILDGSYETLSAYEKRRINKLLGDDAVIDLMHQKRTETQLSIF